MWSRSKLLTIMACQSVSIETTSSESAAGSSAGTKPERFTTGLELKVTPQVNSEGK